MRRKRHPAITMKNRPTDEQYRNAALVIHGSDGTFEIDLENAVVSLSDDDGAYVQAWV